MSASVQYTKIINLGNWKTHAIVETLGISNAFQFLSKNIVIPT